jgi:YVTN family beta-propeller protein
MKLLLWAIASPLLIVGAVAQIQAPALPGAPPIGPDDRIYTGDQTSNTITVIKPLTNEVLGTISLGASRLTDVLSPQYLKVVNSHGLGFSLDGKYINSVATTTNTLTVIRTLDNSIVSQTSVDRASHEGFFAHDNRTVWVACRGTKFVDIVDGLKGGVVGRVETPTEGPSKVLFSPDGQTAYVNHILSPTLDIIDVQQRKVVDTITGLADKFSSDMMMSADGQSMWVAHKKAGKTTVIDLTTRTIVTVVDTGLETNHPNFAIVDGTQYAFVTSGGLNATMVYRQDSASSIPVFVKSIRSSGVQPHGIWGSPDNTRMYTVNEHSDTVDVIDTRSLTVIDTLKVGQEGQALVYVAGAVPDCNGTQNLGRQGLDKRIENRVVAVTNSTKGTALFTIRALVGLDMFQIIAGDLEINQTYVARAVCHTCNGAAVPIVEFKATTPEVGHMGCAVAPQVLSFLRFFGVYDVNTITLQLKSS